MEEFEILVVLNGNDEILLVIPIVDGEGYKVFNGIEDLGIINADLNDEGIIWYCDKLISSELLAQIGDKIEKHFT